MPGGSARPRACALLAAFTFATAINLESASGQVDTGPHVRAHDGTYARIATGAGMLQGSLQDDAYRSEERELSGFLVTLDVALGGSPLAGLAVGGTAWLVGLPSASYQFTDDGEDAGHGSMASGMIGAFMDGFPDPAGGFHVGGALGYGFANFTDLEPRPGIAIERDPETSGAALQLWSGYDAWIDRRGDWAVGPLLRGLVWGLSSGEAGLAAITLSLSLLHH